MDGSSRKSFQLGRHIRHVGRLAQIANVLARHGFLSVLEQSRILKSLSPEQIREVEETSLNEAGIAPGGEHGVSEVPALPRRLRMALEDLGPTFIKLGQVLALREDLLPHPFIEELRRLHSTVDPLPFAVIEKVLKDELAAEQLAQIASIEEKPLAAGSIGQVHRALLANGAQVVIKVQRPAIEPQIRIDVSLMEMMSSLMEKSIPELGNLRLRAMVQEFARATLTELDFIREAGSTTKVRANLAGIPYASIPEVHWDLTTTRVLTSSYLEGLPVLDRKGLVDAGLSPRTLLERGLGIFLQMVFVDGLYHGDLHPGNLLALPDNHVGLLDFGLTMQIGRVAQQHVAGLLVSLMREDYEGMVSHFIELSDPSPDFDSQAFVRDVGNSLAPFMGLSMQGIRSGKLLWDMASIAAQHGAPMPSDTVMILRTVAAFEGLAAQLDPTFDMLKACEKYTDQIVAQMYSPEYLKKEGLIIARDLAYLARHAPFQIRKLLRMMADGDLSINVTSDEFTRVALALDRSSSRMAVSMILASLIIGSSILVYAKVNQGPWNIGLLGTIGFSIAGVLGFYVIWSIIRGGNKL